MLEKTKSSNPIVPLDFSLKRGSSQITYAAKKQVFLFLLFWNLSMTPRRITVEGIAAAKALQNEIKAIFLLYWSFF